MKKVDGGRRALFEGAAGPLLLDPCPSHFNRGRVLAPKERGPGGGSLGSNKKSRSTENKHFELTD
jgi:hypothetical protein